MFREHLLCQPTSWKYSTFLTETTFLLGQVYYLLLVTFRCGRFPPEVRTAIPVDGRFEHIVLSCNATSDHAILWIEREAQKSLEVSTG